MSDFFSRMRTRVFGGRPKASPGVPPGRSQRGEPEAARIAARSQEAARTGASRTQACTPPSSEACAPPSSQACAPPSTQAGAPSSSQAGAQSSSSSPSGGGIKMTPRMQELESEQLALLLSLEEENFVAKLQAASLPSVERQLSNLDFRQFTKDEAIARFKTIISRCDEFGVLFVDDSFVPGPKILYENGYCRRKDAQSLLVVQHFGGGKQDLEWQRSCAILQRPGDLQITCDNLAELVGTMRAYSRAVEWRVYQPGGILPDDVSQGGLGNCWFCGVLGAIAATRPKCLLQLFVMPNDGATSRYGAYLVKLFDGGSWVYIALDDYFPVIGNHHGYFMAFSGARRNQLWVPLLEKAYSKLKGSYERIEGGNPADALRLFTGWPSVTQTLRKAEDHTIDVDPNSFELQAQCPYVDDDLLWARILSAETAGLIIVGSCGFVQADQHYKAVGLSPSHCYGIERAVTTTCGRRLLLVRNPWGSGLMWSGPFSDDDKSWTKRIRDEVRYEKKVGVFWMPLAELKKYFMSLSFSTYRAGWHQHLDVINDVIFGEPIWNVRIVETTEVLFSLMQMEEKWNEYVRDLLLVVMTEDGRFIGSSNRGTTANELLSIVLQPGNYRVVPISSLSFGGSDLYIGMAFFFSKRGYEITRRMPNVELRQKAVAHFARRWGKQKTYFGDLHLWSAHQAGIIVFVENRSKYRTYRFDMKLFDIFNMEFSRPLRQVGDPSCEQFVLSDSIPPLHAMVVIIGSGRVGGYRDAFESKFKPYDGEIHDPPVCPFHSPYALI